MVLVSCLILIGFVLGVVAVVAAEALGVLWIIKRLDNEIKKRDVDKNSSESLVGGGGLDTRQSLAFLFKKQGLVWVLESDKIPKIWLDRPSREPKRKKEFVEVSPVKKYGKITGQSLILMEFDGLHTTIQLKGCSVEAVSAANLSSKKWAKKLPIKVESKTSAIYNGSKIFYIYLETSWEKESWCKALRLASCDQNETLKWFSQLHEEFQSYLISLNAEYNSFMKPSVGSSVEAIERASKPESAPSKVRQFFKKLSRKTSKVGLDNKLTSTSLSGCEERKNTEKLRACQDSVLAINLMKTASAKHFKSSTEDNMPPLSSNLSHSEDESHISVGFGADSAEKNGIDEATLCWNMLISRLFFDAKGSAELKRSIQAKIQKQLSSVRTPSYVGEIILTKFCMGNFPPLIMGMRVHATEMSEVLALEVDIEYSGGALLEIETRLEVGELDLHKEIEDSNPYSSNAGDVPVDLLKGFDYLGKQLDLAEGASDLQEPKENGDGNTDVSKSFKSASSSSSSGSRWKSMLNSFTKHVSQVPISLAMRVTSIRGTLRLYIKPPPSDQLWFGFTSMPDIDFNPQSSIGDHKITSGHVASFLVKVFKIGIRENLVLPNCECICFPFMLAEQDDWVPFNVAPFIWPNQASGNENSPSMDTPNLPAVGVNARSEANARTPSDSEHELLRPKSVEFNQEPANKSTNALGAPSSSFSIPSGLEELRTPLLEKAKEKPKETRDLKEQGAPSLEKVKPEESRVWRSPLVLNVRPQETSELEVEDNLCPSTQRLSMNLLETQDTMDETRRKKMGRKEKMHDLRRKMSEKFEEKKRHIGEKSKHIVDKMRGPREL